MRRKNIDAPVQNDSQTTAPAPEVEPAKTPKKTKIAKSAEKPESKPKAATKGKKSSTPVVVVADLVTPAPIAEDAPVEPAAKANSRATGKKAKSDPILIEAAPAPTSAKKKGASKIKPSPVPAETPSIEPVALAPVEPVANSRPAKKTSAKSDTPKAEAPVIAPAPAQPEPKKVTTSSRRPAAKAKPAPTVAEPAVAYDLSEGIDLPFGEELPVPEWRPVQPRTKQNQPGQRAKQAAPAVAQVRPEETEDQEEGEASDPNQRNDRKRRRRRRPGRDRATQTPETPTEVAAAAPALVESSSTELPADEPFPTASFRSKRQPEPVVPVRRAIDIPENAPQVVMRNGVPTLVRNLQAYPPIMFFGSPADEKRATTVLDELRMAADAGVHLHSHLVEFEVDPASVDAAVGFAAYMLARSVEVDPDSQIIFRLVFQAPRYWVDRFPNAKYRAADGTVAEPSLCDDDFWGIARECLETFVKKLRLLDTSDHIMGVHLERGEWFFAESWGYDTSKSAQTKFRDWSRTRYRNDEVTLRASWFDGSARFDNITVPEFQPEGAEGDKFVRSSRKQRRYVDYHLFLSDMTVSRISDLAYGVKAASDGMFIVGVSYGYTFEWSHPSSGHLALGKMLRAPEIDFVAGPPSYRTREPGGSSPFPGPIDSFALNGKLYISEEDFKTSLSAGHEPDDFNPVIKTPQALESIHWRGAGAALAHGSGVAWMDLWGNGWLRTHSVWQRASAIRNAQIERMTVPPSDPEVAVFIDERALAYLVDQNAFTLLVQNVREAVLRAGVSAAFYLLSDLAHREKFPESKLYLFLNAWDIRPELRAAIKSRLQKDNKVLFWLYSAGLFDAGRDSLERAREVTGIALKPQPFHSKAGTTIVHRRHPLSEAFPDKSLAAGSKLEPSYFAIPEEATVLGEYTQTGLPSFVVKEFKEHPDPKEHWTSVFLGEPLVNPALIRALAQMAGAHVYNFHEDVVHVRPPFCTVHCAGAGPRAITLPNKWSAYNLLTGQWSALDSTNLRFTATEGSTHVFLIGPKVDLEHLLQTDPDEVLKLDHLPPREVNVLHDMSAFDVPIMRLDEWMEGSDTDEVADEWFLRPPQMPEEAPEPAVESTERIGRRRRRRRGGRNDRGGSDEPNGSRGETTAVVEHQFDDLGLNVMFRKRE
jgi:hypothetical protein